MNSIVAQRRVQGTTRLPIDVVASCLHWGLVQLGHKRPRPGNLWMPPVSWKCGRRSNRIGKSHCFNGFQVALNMLKATSWSPAEPAWDFKVCAAPRSNGHFAGGGWLPTGVPSVITCNRPTTRPARFRPAGGRRRVYCHRFARFPRGSWKGCAVGLAYCAPAARFFLLLFSR